MTDPATANEFIATEQSVILLFLFRFPFILQTELGLFLLFFSALILLSLITHFSFSFVENDLCQTAPPKTRLLS